MERINLHVGERLAKSEHNYITGDIYFQADANFFPAENYNDFPAIILSWWIKEIYRLCYSNECELLFMDDPYLIEVEKIDSDLLRMKYCRTTWNQSQQKEQKVIEYENLVSKKRLVHVVLGASNKLLMELEKSGWSNAVNVQELKDTVEKYSILIKQFEL